MRLRVLALVFVYCASEPLSAAQVDRLGNQNGSVETGLALGLAPGYTQGMVDQVEWNQRFDASERVKFHLNHSVALLAPTATGPGSLINTADFLSALAITGGPTGNFVLANTAAYLTARLSESLSVSVGHMRVPFGLQWEAPRYDHLLYYYSQALGDAAAQGWLWDLGVQLEVRKVLPGKLKVALLDGRTLVGQTTPAFSANYQFTWDLGSVVLLPEVFLYLGEFSSGPLDTGFGAGFSLLSGSFTLNTEFLRAREGVPGGGAAALFSSSSFVVEPSLDLGIVEAGVGAEYKSTTAGSDVNLRAVVMKHFADRLRLRVLFQAANLLGQTGTGEQEIRLLVGTHW